MSSTRARVLAAIAILVVTLVWLDTHPLRLPATGPRAEPGVTVREDGHPVLLLVDGAGLRAARPRRLTDRWPDLEWDNLLTQAFGGCDVLDLAQLDRPLEERDLVVVPRRTAGRLSPGQLERLDGAVRAGLDVLVEAPDSSLCRHFGLELAAVERRARLPWPQPTAVTNQPVRALRPADLEIAWTRFRYAPPPLSVDERPTVHLSLDGRPLGWVTRSGEGSWIVLALDFAELASRLRQGTLADDLRVDAPAPDATDLVASPGLLAADDAWLDAWVEGVLGGQLTEAPLPRLATAPFEADGWLLVSTLSGPELASVTRFAPANEPAAAAPASGLLTLWPGAGAPDQEIGLGPFRPFVRALGLDAQRARFVATTGRSPLINRNAAGRWSRDPDLPYAMVLGAGIDIDCSLGAATEAAGWLFGSGVPFLPLASDGRAFALHEVVVHGGPGSDRRRLDRWLRHNADGGAGPVHVLLEDDSALAEIDRIAARRRHLRNRPDELVGWWRRRASVILRPRSTADGIEVRIEKPGDEGFALLVPLRWRDGALAGWDADWGVAASRRVQRFDRAYRLIELDARAEGGTLRLRYF